jgi:hypothetical protein
MGKLYPALMLIVAIEVAMKLFLGVTTPITSLLDLILNPYNWSLTSFVISASNTIGLAGIAGIVIGSFWSKGDFLVYAGIAALFFSYGKVFGAFGTTIANVINSQSSMGAGNIVAFFIMAPIIVLYIYTIFKFWQGDDS